jgi:hypothetical protein
MSFKLSLATAVAISLVGCGSDSGDDTPEVVTPEVVTPEVVEEIKEEVTSDPMKSLVEPSQNRGGVVDAERAADKNETVDINFSIGRTVKLRETKATLNPVVKYEMTIKNIDGNEHTFFPVSRQFDFYDMDGDFVLENVNAIYGEQLRISVYGKDAEGNIVSALRNAEFTVGDNFEIELHLAIKQGQLYSLDIISFNLHIENGLYSLKPNIAYPYTNDLVNWNYKFLQINGTEEGENYQQQRAGTMEASTLENWFEFTSSNIYKLEIESQAEVEALVNLQTEHNFFCLYLEANESTDILNYTECFSIFSEGNGEFTHQEHNLIRGDEKFSGCNVEVTLEPIELDNFDVSVVGVSRTIEPAGDINLSVNEEGYTVYMPFINTPEDGNNSNDRFSESLKVELEVSVENGDDFNSTYFVDVYSSDSTRYCPATN